MIGGREGIGTSWDTNIRFGSNGITSPEQDLKLWEENVRFLNGYTEPIKRPDCRNFYNPARYITLSEKLFADHSV